jgi:hypothetical protein
LLPKQSRCMMMPLTRPKHIYLKGFNFAI